MCSAVDRDGCFVKLSRSINFVPPEVFIYIYIWPYRIFSGCNIPTAPGKIPMFVSAKILIFLGESSHSCAKRERERKHVCSEIHQFVLVKFGYKDIKRNMSVLYIYIIL